MARSRFACHFYESPPTGSTNLVESAFDMTEQLDPSRMFIDYSPFPNKVLEMRGYVTRVAIAIPMAASPWVVPERPDPFDTSHADMVELQKYWHRFPNGLTALVYRGWHEPTRTVILGPWEVFDPDLRK